MPIEEVGGGSQLRGALLEGLEVLDQNAIINFVQYQRFVLPIDGYVFWLRTATSQFKGSLHYSTVRRQEADQTLGLNRVLFTSEEEITAFNAISPTVLFVGEHKGMRFSFSQRGFFYDNAKLWHYEGDSIYPAFASQLVDDLSAFDQTSQVVSNSLPIWLSLNNFQMPVFYPWTAFPTVYPAFLSPANIEPPYIVAEIPPESTRTLQPVPTLDRTYNHLQLCADRVSFIFFGMRNAQALDFMDFVYQLSLDSPWLSLAEGTTPVVDFGVMTPGPIRDDRARQVEISAMAQRKTLEIEVSYFQERTNGLARQLIKSAIATITSETYPGA